MERGPRNNGEKFTQLTGVTVDPQAAKVADRQTGPIASNNKDDQIWRVWMEHYLNALCLGQDYQPVDAVVGQCESTNPKPSPLRSDEHPLLGDAHFGEGADDTYRYEDLLRLKRRWEEAAQATAGNFQCDIQLEFKESTVDGKKPLRRLLVDGPSVAAGTIKTDDVDDDVTLVATDRYQFVLAKQLHKMTQESGCCETEVTAIMEDMKNRYIMSLNRGAWRTIRRKVSEERDIANQMTPVNSNFDRAFADYDSDGWSSMSRNLPSNHPGHQKATNLWHSQLSVEGQPVFQAFRSGSIGARGIGDETQERMLSRAKALEVLKAMAVKQYREKGEPIFDLDVVSISLQTNTQGKMYGLKYIRDFDEGRDVWLQCQALQHFDGKEQYIRVGNDVICVKFNVMTFNTGVNAAATHMGEEQDKINEPSVRRLCRLFENWLQEDRPEAVKQIATQLMSHITDNWSFKKGAKDYLLPAAIANLANLMGNSVHFNCKSGKDRTSVMDVESKLMAVRILEYLNDNGAPDSIQEIYALDQQHADDAHRQLHKELFLNGGNLLLQELNVGVKGYKITPRRKIHPQSWQESLLEERISPFHGEALGLARAVTVKPEYSKKEVKKKTKKV